MNKVIHTFPKSLIPKVTVIARVEFELAYYAVTVQYLTHYTTGTTPTSFGAIE